MTTCLEKTICTTVYIEYIDNFEKIVSKQPLGTLVHNPSQSNKCFKYHICLDRLCNLVTAFFKNNLPNTFDANFSDQLPEDAVGVLQVYLNACSCDIRSPFVDPTCRELFCWQPKSNFNGKAFSFLACGPLVTALCNVPIIEPLTSAPKVTALQVILPSGSPDEEQRICIRPKNISDTVQPFVFDNTVDLTNNTADRTPQWSPNAKSVVFRRGVGGNTGGVYKTDASGMMNETQLTVGSDINPQWSPDGCRVAFSRRGFQSDHIYTTDTNGNMNELQLTMGNVSDVTPQYSPNGSQIIFKRNQEGIFVLSTNTPNSEMQLTSSIHDIDPQWSPDGSKIVFSRDDPTGGIIVFDLVTLQEMSVTNNVGQIRDRSPQWSPDGTQIVFSREISLGSPRNIVVIDVDGTNQIVLTNDGVNVFNLNPQWSPDGTKIVFQRFDNVDPSTQGITVVNASGGPLIQLTFSTNQRAPQWSPAGDCIVFENTNEGIQKICLGQMWNGQLSASVSSTWIAMPLEKCN